MGVAYLHWLFGFPQSRRDGLCRIDGENEWTMPKDGMTTERQHKAAAPGR